MTRPRFIQVHTLVSYPAALLNRDDSGLAKRMPFGDAIRTRVSSQCLKRHWRKADDRWSLDKIGPEMAVRSRQIPERRIGESLKAAKVTDEKMYDAVVATFARLIYNPKEKAIPKIKDRQILLIGNVEIDYLSKKAVEVALRSVSPEDAIKEIETWFKRGEKNNLNAMIENRRGKLEAGLEAALFGRFVTSDPDANTDAAIHVAHAFTVHGEQAETDYFTVVDDLETGSGAGGIFDTELTAGLFYAYTVVDVPKLVENILGNDAALAAKTIEHLIHLIATVSPGAKKGSTAPYAWADLMLIETGDRQPRSLANAFRVAVLPSVMSATEACANQLGKFDAMYGVGEARRAAALDTGTTLPGVAALESLDLLAAGIAAQVAAD